MTSRVVAALLAGSALLGGIIVVELAAPDGAAPAGSSPAPAVERAPPERIQRPRVDDLLATTLERPLFRATRRPPSEGAQPASPDIGDVRLTGIVVEAQRRLAIFAMPGAAKTLLRGEGETVNDWRLDQIAEQEVTLSGPGGTRTLHLKTDATLARRALLPTPRPAASTAAPPFPPPAAKAPPPRPVVPAATPRREQR